MANLLGTNIAATIVPYTDADKYATHNAIYGKGGFRSVDTIAQRDAIPTERKTKGMLCLVNDNDKVYKWNGTSWVDHVPSQIPGVNTRLDNLESWKDVIGNKNVANGVAGLGSDGKLSAGVLPAGYDNVDFLQNFVSANPTSGMITGQMWYNTVSKKIITATGATNVKESNPDGNDKIYINVNDNKSYRWTGDTMVAVGDGNGVALGITANTAFRGDYGNILYTNFGSGDNLVGTQKARNFFKETEASEKYIKSATINHAENKVDINIGFRNFQGTSTNATETINAASNTEAGVMTSAMFRTLQELELNAFPLTLNVSGAGVFEKGSSTTAGVVISVTRKGANVTANSTIVVTPPNGITGSLNAGKTLWTPSTNINTNATISVKATYGAQSQTKTINYTFKLNKYYGVSNKATLTNAEIIALSKTWADSRTMNQTNFDCTGGKYPYYIIPTSIAVGLEWWVGGLKNSDIDQQIIQLTNASGHTESYTVFRLNNIQTGILSIQFK